MQCDMAKAQLWAVRDKSVAGDLHDLASTDILSGRIRQQQVPLVQGPLRSPEK